MSQPPIDKESELSRTRKKSVIYDSPTNMTGSQRVSHLHDPSTVAAGSRKTSVLHDSVPNMTGPTMRRQSRFEPRGPMSTFASRRMSMMSQTSVSGASGHKIAAIPIKYQNTYRLGPDSDDIFKPSHVEKAMVQVLDKYLIGEMYETEKCKVMAKNISDEIRSRCKELVYARYKIVCYVAIGQDCNQSVQLSSRSLWNTDTDNSSTIKYRHNDLFAVVTVFAVHFD